MWDKIVYNLIYNDEFIGLMLLNLIIFGVIIALIGAAIDKNKVSYFGGGMILLAFVYGFIGMLASMVSDLFKAWV